ncbi:hypothetical protein M231_01714 [Tremella mesenterica]|uniref:Uncharacterized protein n=1 Tax=Tremella mesenterica TaxID=5217 RepID=A0A4Q1BSR6_TREME|nr:hypothetical protein M231_01714 [Tremella mesenterica]
MNSIFRPFPLPQTGRQWFYLTVLQGVGAGLIDGGINFAIAYAMYHNQDNIRMWVLKHNTIAGDLGVTPIIQCLASMLITSTLVHTDLHHRAIQPLPFVYPHVESLPDPRKFFKPSQSQSQSQSNDSISKPSNQEKQRPSSGLSTPDTLVEPNSRPATTQLSNSDETSSNLTDIVLNVNNIKKEDGKFRYYFWMLVRFIFEGTEKNMLLHRTSVRTWFGRLFWTAGQGALIGIIFGFPIWCLAIIILGPIYGNGNIGSKWAPQVIKLIYGAVVGWITNPVIATLALGSQADHHLVIVPISSDVENQITDDIHPIPEEDETVQHTIPPTVQTPGGSPKTLRRPILMGSLSSPSKPNSIGMNVTKRSRAASVTSTKPPLCANVSNIPLIQSSLESPSRPRSGTNRTNASIITPPSASVGSMSRATGGRPRGATTSSAISQGSYSYALGGTGGRAKRTARSRAGTFVDQAEGQIPQTAPVGERMDGGNDNLSLEEGGLRSAPVGNSNTRLAGERTPVWNVFSESSREKEATTESS